MSMKISVIGGVSIDFSQLEPSTQKQEVPVITQVAIGKKVRFVPAFVPRECNFSAGPNEPVTGKVVYVNHKHGYFTAEYGWEGSKQRESFKFSQIGKDVTVCG